MRPCTHISYCNRGRFNVLIKLAQCIDEWRCIINIAETAEKTMRYKERQKRTYGIYGNVGLGLELCKWKEMYCGQSVLTNLKTNLKILTIFSIKICCNLPAYTAYCHVVTSSLHVFTSVYYLRGFGLSYTVPVPKCDSRSRTLTVDDFRG